MTPRTAWLEDMKALEVQLNRLAICQYAPGQYGQVLEPGMTRSVRDRVKVRDRPWPCSTWADTGDSSPDIDDAVGREVAQACRA